MNNLNTVKDGLLSNKPPSEGENGLNSPKLKFNMLDQKSSPDFVNTESANLLHMQFDEMIESNSSIGSIPQASLGFKYSSAEPIYEGTEHSDDNTEKANFVARLLKDSHPKEQTNLSVTCNNTTEQDPSLNDAKEMVPNRNACMSHVLVQFGRTYAVCYVPHKHRGTFGLDELVLCEAAHGEATGVSVADLTPYIDEIRIKQAEVLKNLQGDPLYPENSIEGGIHWPLYQKTVICGLNCDNCLVRLPRVLRRGVNKDKKRVHFLQRRNGEALRVIQAVLRERQWESALDVADVAYQGDFLSTTLHLHGHPDASNWQPLEYRRAGESFTALLRTNIVEFRHSYDCPEQLHITRNIVGHTLDKVFSELLRSYAIRKDASSSKRSLRANTLPASQRPFSLPAMLPTVTSLPAVLPFGTSGLSTSQASCMSEMSCTGFTTSGNIPYYPPPKYPAEAKMSHSISSIQANFAQPVAVLGATPGKRAEPHAFVSVQRHVPALPAALSSSYLVPLTTPTSTDSSKAQTLYYMMPSQSLPSYTGLVTPQMQIQVVNPTLLAPSAAVYTSPPHLVGYTPQLDPHGFVAYPPQSSAATTQGWVDYVPLSEQRGSVPALLHNNAGYS